MMSTGTRRTTSHKNHHHTSLLREPQSLIPTVKNSAAEKKKQDDHRLPRPVRKRMHVLGDPIRESKSALCNQPSPSQEKRVQCRLGLALSLSRVLMPGRSTAMAPSVPQASTAELSDSRNSRKRPR